MTHRGWQNWTRCHWREQGIDAVAKAIQNNQAGSAAAPEEISHEGNEAEVDSKDLTQYLTGPVLPPTITPAHTLVYLSADADEELTTLSENELYIIGGVVDRNRYKVREVHQ
jgi:tRNA (guanine9-N1)-methyltransferase